MTISKLEVLRRLCQLASEVREHQPLIASSGQRSLAADCFCGQANPDWIRATQGDDYYCFESAVMEFIESAVREVLKAEMAHT